MEIVSRLSPSSLEKSVELTRSSSNSLIVMSIFSTVRNLVILWTVTRQQEESKKVVFTLHSLIGFKEKF